MRPDQQGNVRAVNALVPAGRVFYGVATIAFGTLHIVHADFVTRVIPWWPRWMPGRAPWAYVIGTALIAAGAALVTNRRVVLVANLLGFALLVSFLTLGVPMVATEAPLGSGWTRAGKALALSGGAFLVAQTSFVTAGARPPGEDPIGGTTRRLWAFAPWFFAAFLVLTGTQHLVHGEFVKRLVPAWIPGALVWTYFTGVALISGGIGLLVPATRRLAGLLSGAMIFTWVIVLHVPRAVSAASHSTNETTAVFEALAMSGIAWLAAVVQELAPRNGRLENRPRRQPKERAR